MMLSWSIFNSEADAETQQKNDWLSLYNVMIS